MSKRHKGIIGKTMLVLEVLLLIGVVAIVLLILFGLIVGPDYSKDRHQTTGAQAKCFTPSWHRNQ